MMQQIHGDVMKKTIEPSRPQGPGWRPWPWLRRSWRDNDVLWNMGCPSPKTELFNVVYTHSNRWVCQAPRLQKAKKKLPELSRPVVPLLLFNEHNSQELAHLKRDPLGASISMPHRSVPWAAVLCPQRLHLLERVQQSIALRLAWDPRKIKMDPLVLKNGRKTAVCLCRWLA